MKNTNDSQIFQRNTRIFNNTNWRDRIDNNHGLKKGNVFPKNQQEAKKWNFWNRTQTGAASVNYKIYEWPDEMRTLAMKDHMNRYERFKLFHFLIQNGGTAELAAHDILRSGNYDKNAERQIREFDKIPQEKLDKYYVHDIYSGRYARPPDIRPEYRSHFDRDRHYRKEIRKEVQN